MKLCSIEGCSNKFLAKGWCSKHYRRWYIHGDPEYVLEKHVLNIEERFTGNIEFQGNCHIWTGSLSAYGYGRIWVDGKHIPTHRYAWEREHGPIPEGMLIDHKDHCDTRCVNVKHLRLATNQQNTSNQSGASSDNKSSGIRNVHRSGRFWVVKIQKNYKTHRFGRFATIEEAAKVAEEARLELFGSFAGKG